MQLNGKRSYGKIASLPPEVRNAVDNMILTCTVRLPEIQAYIEEQAGVDVSTSTISRYGKRLSETYRDLTIAQENFEALRKELEKYPVHVKRCDKRQRMDYNDSSVWYLSGDYYCNYDDDQQTGRRRWRREDDELRKKPCQADERYTKPCYI